MKNADLFWREYWDNAQEPQHRYESEAWLDFYARELLLYLPERLGRVLEIGCGNGWLYPAFREQCSSYNGIDLSHTMLRAFKRAVDPMACLICADAVLLPLNDVQFDVVLSNGMCQYLNRSRIESHIRRVADVLASDGVYLMANVPDSQLRLLHYGGFLREDRGPSLRQVTRGAAILLGLKKSDGIGYWYSRRDIHDIAGRQGLTCATFSSASYEYRFHATLRRSDTNRRK